MYNLAALAPNDQTRETHRETNQSMYTPNHPLHQQVLCSLVVRREFGTIVQES